MARIVGSSFKAPIIQRTGPQETAMDRALASFVSPAGVYLLAQGIGALGKLPFRSKEGGVDMVAEAARKKSAAINQLRDAQLTKSQLKPGRTQREVVEQRDRMAPRDTDKMPGTLKTPTQRNFSAEIEAIEGQKKLQMQRATQLEMLLGNMSADDPDRATVADQRRQALGIISELKEAQDKLRPRDEAEKLVDTKVRELSDHMATGISSEIRGATVPEQRILDMVAQAQREGRASTAADAAELSESAIRERMEQELPTPQVIQQEQLENLSIQELQDLANRTRKDLKRFGAESRAFQDKFGEQINPLIVQQNIDKSVEARTANREAINRELRKRGREVAQRAPVSFLSERGQQLAALSPFQQKQELRRMAREVKSEEQAKEVRDLLGRFAPVRETLGDYFRTDDEIATEFEKEVVDLIPKFDPDAGQKRRLREAQIKQAEADVEQKKATTAKTAAETGQALLVALVNADAKKRRAAASAAAAQRKQQLKGKEDSAKRAQADLNREIDRLLNSIRERAVRIRASKELNELRRGTTPENIKQRYQKLYVTMGKDYIKNSVAVTDAAALMQGQLMQAAGAQLDDFTKLPGSRADELSLDKPKSKQGRSD